MSDDWKPGDLALAVRDGWCPVRLQHMGIRKGGIYTVSAVAIRNDDYGRPTLCIGLPHVREGEPGLNARWFRKINPLTDQEREEALRELSPPLKVEA